MNPSSNISKAFMEELATSEKAKNLLIELFFAVGPYNRPEGFSVEDWQWIAELAEWDDSE